ncbi:MAG: hypothetical protein ABI869_05605 [Actinomycetota bacterium]
MSVYIESADAELCRSNVHPAPVETGTYGFAQGPRVVLGDVGPVAPVDELGEPVGPDSPAVVLPPPPQAASATDMATIHAADTGFFMPLRSAG